MSRDTVDIYNPKVIRSTMGSIFRVPFVYADNMEQVMEFLKKIKLPRMPRIWTEQTIQKKITGKVLPFLSAMKETG